MAHGGHRGGGDTSGFLDVSHVGNITSVLLIGGLLWLVLFPVRFTRAFGKIILAGLTLAPIYVPIYASLGPEDSLWNHPLLCLPLVLVGAWVSDDIRAKSNERAAVKQGRAKARYDQ